MRKVYFKQRWNNLQILNLQLRVPNECILIQTTLNVVHAHGRLKPQLRSEGPFKRYDWIDNLIIRSFFRVTQMKCR